LQSSGFVVLVVGLFPFFLGLGEGDGDGDAFEALSAWIRWEMGKGSAAGV
jgi:hypothetical protein